MHSFGYALEYSYPYSQENLRWKTKRVTLKMTTMTGEYKPEYISATRLEHIVKLVENYA